MENKEWQTSIVIINTNEFEFKDIAGQYVTYSLPDNGIEKYASFRYGKLSATIKIKYGKIIKVYESNLQCNTDNIELARFIKEKYNVQLPLCR